ncbi:PTS sugar transporter subunit IIC [Kluyvera sp. STS39-E]|uniref:PTS sugar transporter subunit IIC n=1 Tax=Kluyvera sp. STS39-E TaxID=3234748 RepID=UPI0034C64822
MPRLSLSTAQTMLTKGISKIAGNRLLLSLRDTFIMAGVPLMIAGFAIMISSVILDPSGILFGPSGIGLGALFSGGNENWLHSPFALKMVQLQRYCNYFINGTMAINALLIIVGFTFFGSRRFFPKNKEPVVCIFYSLAAFFICLPWEFTTTDIHQQSVTLSGIVNTRFIGQEGIFTGLLVSGITIWMFNRLVEKNFTIKMPDSVPPAVARSFESLIPGSITLLFFVVLAAVLHAYFNSSVPEVLLMLLQKPTLAVASTSFFAVVAIVTGPLLQWFGIHATSVWGPIFGLTWVINDNENIMGVAHHLYSTLFLNFSTVSSGGMTLAPIIAVYLFSKRMENRKTAKFALAPAIFNISEPINFGLPIILNPVMFIPYVLSWVIPFFGAVMLTKMGILPIIIHNVPWTVPPIISGILFSGHISGGLYQLLVIVVMTAIYMPFIKIANSMNEKLTAQ